MNMICGPDRGRSSGQGERAETYFYAEDAYAQALAGTSVREGQRARLLQLIGE